MNNKRKMKKKKEARLTHLGSDPCCDTHGLWNLT
jgi:hypothetical protein